MTDDTKAMDVMAAEATSASIDAWPAAAIPAAAEPVARVGRPPRSTNAGYRSGGRHTPLLHAIIRDRIFWEAKERLGLGGDAETGSDLSDGAMLDRFKSALYGDEPEARHAHAATGGPSFAPGRWLAGHRAPMVGKLGFLEAVARSLGDDWSNDSRSFLDVTIAMGRLQLVLRQIVHASDAQGDRVVRGQALVTVPPCEAHHFAQCMIEELFRADGWTTDLFWPEHRTAITDRIAERGHDIVCLSWSTGALAEIARDTINAIESMPFERRPAIIAGGRASHEHSGWLVRLGVDCICESTYGALAAARRLLETRASSNGGSPLSSPLPSPAPTP